MGHFDAEAGAVHGLYDSVANVHHGGKETLNKAMMPKKP